MTATGFCLNIHTFILFSAFWITRVLQWECMTLLRANKLIFQVCLRLRELSVWKPCTSLPRLREGSRPFVTFPSAQQGHHANSRRNGGKTYLRESPGLSGRPRGAPITQTLDSSSDHSPAILSSHPTLQHPGPCLSHCPCQPCDRSNRVPRKDTLDSSPQDPRMWLYFETEPLLKLLS